MSMTKSTTKDVDKTQRISHRDDTTRERNRVVRFRVHGLIRSPMGKERGPVRVSSAAQRLSGRRL